MVIMTTKPKRMSVYKTMMRRRVFTKWSNLLLTLTDKQIVDIFDVNERKLLDRLFEIVLKESVTKFQDTTAQIKQREIILEKAESFKGNYLSGHQGQDVNRRAVLKFIWDLIEYFHISPGKHFWQNENSTAMNAKEVLLQWLNGKLQGRNVKNFTTDWNDGTLLCELVNALGPGLVAPKLFLQGSWPHRNVTVAMETAEKEWGIPAIISVDDMISLEVDELSVMTYVSLFFEHDLQRLSANHTASMDNGHVGKSHTTVNDNVKMNHISENGVLNANNNADEEDFTNVSDSILNSSIYEKIENKSELGRVGKVVEYILNLHDVKANEITVSVEYNATGKLKQEYKPDLKVFSLGKGRFRVKYTPNVAGNYRLSLFYEGEHIGDSPYCLKVPAVMLTKENGRIDTNNNTGQNSDKSPSNGTTEQVGTNDGFYGFDGNGLKRATVGKLAVFTVITDNRDKGPLSVCINCPAVSIPVPHVKTTYSLNYSSHTVTYMPTLAGTYNICVRWGLKLINGCPFHVEVTDHDVFKPMALLKNGSKECDKKRQSTEFSHIKVYYSSSSLDPDVIRDTVNLEELLARYGISKGGYDDIWVSMDVELEKDERELVFRLAGTRRLPLVFIHEKCLGGYEDVKNLDEINELERTLRYKVRKV